MGRVDQTLVENLAWYGRVIRFICLYSSNPCFIPILHDTNEALHVLERPHQSQILTFSNVATYECPVLEGAGRVYIAR